MIWIIDRFNSLSHPKIFLWADPGLSNECVKKGMKISNNLVMQMKIYGDKKGRKFQNFEILQSHFSYTVLWDMVTEAAEQLGLWSKKLVPVQLKTMSGSCCRNAMPDQTSSRVSCKHRQARQTDCSIPLESSNQFAWLACVYTIPLMTYARRPKDNMVWKQINVPEDLRCWGASCGNENVSVNVMIIFIRESFNLARPGHTCAL